MPEFLKNLFANGPFIPHGHCYLWKPELVWLHIISDSLIALAYYSIPITLVYFVRKRQDLPFNWIFLLFGSFIIACGTTHLMEIWTLWHPTYWLSGAIKAITALVSVYTALELVPLVPKALALPSPAQLEATNQELLHQITQRQQADDALQKANNELETKVENRTAELLKANEELKIEIIQRQQVLESLQESEERFRLLVEGAKDYAIYMLEPKGHIVTWNTGAQRIKGYKPGEIIGQHISSFYTTEDIKQGKPELELRVAASEGRVEDEGWRVRKDGSLFWANVVTTALHDQVGQLRGFAKVTRDITERKRAEETQRHTQERLQALSGKLIEAQEAERRSIARELHDEIGQALTAVKINLQALPRSSNESDIASPLLESISIVEVALQQVRNLSLDLRPSLLDDLGLVAALRWYVDRQSQRSGIIGELAAEPLETKLLPNLETTCFRIVQEALTNVVRYAQAKRVTVELWQQAAQLHLVIRDDGIGFDVQAAREQATQGKSLGLLGMEERALLVGGQIHIKSVCQRGTEIRVCFPLNTHQS
jgi:PAS domain S-box-containing protein